VRGEEVVGGREDLGAGRQPEAAVQEAETHRRRVGERDLPRGAADVRGRLGPDARLERALALVDVAVGVGVEAAPMAFDRLAHGTRVRREHEPREVVDGRIDVELRTDVRPVADRARRRGTRRRACGGAPGQCGRAGGEPRPDDDLPPREHLPTVRRCALCRR
jgi:hypothetical protein